MAGERLKRAGDAVGRLIARRQGASKAFGRGQWVYLVHVLALITPGEQVPLHRAHQIYPRELTGWETEDLEIMVAEGRRQADRQLADLDQMRTRAQWLFTVGAPIVVAIAAVWPDVDKSDSGWALAVWLIGLVFATYGVAGAAAIMTVRADLESIDTAVLSGYEPPVLAKLAADYAAMLATGENTVATRLTVFRQAAVFLIIGSYAGLSVWLGVH